MRPRTYRHRHSAGFSVMISVLVLATFSLVLLLVLQQRRAVEERHVKQTLQVRLNREVEREILRLSRSASGAPRVRPQGAGPPGVRPHGAARVRQAIDNVLARSFDQMLALEQRRATLRRLLRQTQSTAQRRRTHQQLRQVGKELEIAKLWVLMLEDRRLAARRLEKSQGKDAGKPPPDTPGASPSNTSLPRLPDWLSAFR